MTSRFLIRLAAAVMPLVAGCGSSYDQAVRTPDGNTVRLSDIQLIVQSETLTNEQKAQTLLDWGLDEELVEFFLGIDLSTLDLSDQTTS
jgi:hypothetical protein